MKLRNVWISLSRIGIKSDISIYDQKDILLLNRISLLVVIFFTIVSIVTYRGIENPIISYLFVFNSLVVLLSFLTSKYLSPEFSKFLISMFIPSAIILVMAYSKSIGATDDLILYLSPRIFLILTSLIPTVLFGYSELKKFSVAIIPSLVSFFFYDKIHALFGVYLEDMSFEYKYYNLFVLMSTFFLIFILAIILYLQKININSEHKLHNLNKELNTSHEELQQQNEEILSINNHLEKQQKVILEQKEDLHLSADQLGQKNKHLTDSIKYAKTIQQAILPSRTKIADTFIDEFILFRPKDVVSGDFYWFVKVENKIFIAVADCTGHGVPGAFMSIVGASLLNKIIKEKKIFQPIDILNNLNTEFVETLKQGQDKNRDGMDICFCLLEKTQEGTQLTYVGAKRPLFMYQNREIIEIKGTRKSIAGLQNEKSFTQQEILLNTGDAIYLSTDGYIDQGNDNRKRFGTPKLKKVLEEIALLSMQEQKIILSNKLLEHQQNAAQRDDIVMIGIRI